MLDQYMIFSDKIGVEGIDVDDHGGGIGWLVKEGALGLYFCGLG